MSPDGEVVDLYGSLTTVIEMDPFEFLEKIASLLDNRTPEYPRVWENYCKIIPEPEFAYSEMSAIGTLLKSLAGVMCVASGKQFGGALCAIIPIPSTIEVCCNRGQAALKARCLRLSVMRQLPTN